VKKDEISSDRMQWELTSGFITYVNCIAAYEYMNRKLQIKPLELLDAKGRTLQSLGQCC